MKTILVGSLAAFAGFCLSVTPCSASLQGTTPILQPVNLGTNSDPARIPLGAVGTISKNGYGIHRIIGAARPCPAGPMRWEGGSELDQNLASVFGISVEPTDSTQVPGEPVMMLDGRQAWARHRKSRFK